MPKLVTGIEAIQSGKPFRNSEQRLSWLDANTQLGDITPADLLKRIWEIKQEPREFWIFNKAVDDYIECQSVIQTVYPNEDGWIKVREVLDE